MDIKVEEISDLIRKQISDFESRVDVSEVGSVLSVGDGIAKLYGLENAMAGELLEFPNNVFGLEGGPRNILTGSTMPGGGAFNFTGGTTTIAATFALTGAVQVSGGTANFSGINFVDLASSVIQSDAGILQLPSPITNTVGLLRLNGGTIQSGGTYGMTGGLLEGAGAFGANAITGGEISPGQSGPGLIGFRSGLNLAAGATLTVSGTGTVPGTQYDQLSVSGAVVLANATLQVASLPSVAAGTTFMMSISSFLAKVGLVGTAGMPFRRWQRLAARARYRIGGCRVGQKSHRRATDVRILRRG